MMILVWLIIGFGIYYIFKNNGINNTVSSKGVQAEELLKQRYVHGDIDDETYIEMMKVIRN